jgi:hypothetical protein
LEQLSSLELFHCGWNCLVKSQELASFSRLPRLKKLWMSGNPLVRTKDYREIISRRLHPCIIPVANVSNCREKLIFLNNYWRAGFLPRRCKFERAGEKVDRRCVHRHDFQLTVYISGGG